MKKREAAEKIFNYLRENKFQPINIRYGDGYFIFDMGEDSVVHFNIKGLYGWWFAMWIQTDPEKLKEDEKEYPAIQFFCQHKLNIDKFKPSRSFFLKELYLNEVESDNDWDFYDIKKMLQMIKRHPFISFTMDGHEECYYNKSYFLYFIYHWFYKVKSKLKKQWRSIYIKIWHGSKVWFINRYKVVDHAELIDQNNDCFEVSPRYSFKIHFKVIEENEDKQNGLEIKLLNKWFRKNFYDEMSLDLTRDGIEGEYLYEK